MIKAADLKSQTVKDLYALARKMGVTGVHSMRKDQLVRALVKAAKAKAAAKSRSAPSGNGKAKLSTALSRRARTAETGSTRATRRGASRKLGKKAGVSESASPRVAKRLRQMCAERERLKDLSTPAEDVAAAAGQESTGSTGPAAAKEPKEPKRRCGKKLRGTAGRDRVVLLVRDAYWLQACWDVTQQSVQRAGAALAEHWHVAEPVLRLLEVDAGATTSAAERLIREIPVHGGVQNWYIDVKDSPNSYRVELGYRADGGRFHCLARSNIVTTPRPGSTDTIDRNWADIAENYEKVYAMSGGYAESSSGGDLQELFEERLRRPMSSPNDTQFGAGAERALRRERDFSFNVDAEMILYGATKPDARVTLGGDPVKLRSDGSFTIRLSMPDRRQVLPVVAQSRDGGEQRTIVIAVERNTKVMEPMIREAHEA